MAYPEGDSSTGPLRVGFDRGVKLSFHGSKVTSDGGLLAYRDLDDALGLSELAGGMLQDRRLGRNGWHALVGMLRRSVFGRLAGYEDVNDAERLARDPAMRWLVGGKAVHKGAASSSQMGRFETEVLTADRNLSALAAAAARAGLQPCQLPADAGAARCGASLVADDAAREAGEDRGQGGLARALRHVPTGEGRDPSGSVRRHPGADRLAQTSAGSSMTAVGRRTSKPMGDVRPDSGDLAEHHSSGRSGAPKAMRLAPNIRFLPPKVAGPAPSGHHRLDQEGSHGKCPFREPVMLIHDSRQIDDAPLTFYTKTLLQTTPSNLSLKRFLARVQCK